jgi:hypothetical protein
MATLSKNGITSGATLQPGHVTQSIDAFTGEVEYDLILSGSLTITGSLEVTGSIIANSISGSLTGNSTTTTYIVSNNQNYMPNPGGTFQGPGNLGILAGATKLTSGISPVINPTILTGKTMQTQYWVTATKVSGSTSPNNNALMVQETSPGIGSFSIKDIGASTNDDVNFIIVYLQ